MNKEYKEKVNKEMNIILDQISEIRFRVDSTLGNENITSILVTLDQLEGQILLKYRKKASEFEYYKES